MSASAKIDLARLLHAAGTDIKMSVASATKADKNIWEHYLDSLTERSVLDATPSDVASFLNSLVSFHRDSPIGRPRSGTATYQARAVQLLVRAYRGLIQLGMCQDNPAEKFAFRFAQNERSAPHALNSHPANRRTGGTIQRILNAASRKPSRSDWKVVRNLALISLALDTAAKPAELLELSTDALTEESDGSRLSVSIGVGDRLRLVLLTRRASACVDDWMRLHVAMGFPAGILFPATARPASLRSIRPLSRPALYKICRGVLEDAGLQFIGGGTPAGVTMLRNTALSCKGAAGDGLLEIHRVSGNCHMENTATLLRTVRRVGF